MRLSQVIQMQEIRSKFPTISGAFYSKYKGMKSAQNPNIFRVCTGNMKAVTKPKVYKQIFLHNGEKKNPNI